MKIFAIAILTLCINFSQGQEAKIKDINILPSPTSSSLIWSIENKFNSYTGSNNINIPLLTLKSYDLEVPIELNYSTNEVRVNDIAGHLGRGWSISSGGKIVRIMNGLPDEYNGTWEIHAETIPALGYLYLNTVGVTIKEFPGNYDEAERKTILRNASFNYYNFSSSQLESAQAWDTQPDEFYFSFGNYSGKFVFDQSGEIYTIPHLNLKIEKTILPKIDYNGQTVNKIVKFKVTTEDGYIYEFGDDDLLSVDESSNRHYNFPVEYIYYHIPYSVYDLPISLNSQGDTVYGIYYGYGVPQLAYSGGFNSQTMSIENFAHFNSTWHLFKITSPTQDFVTFDYESVNLTYFQNRAFNISLPNFGEHNGYTGWEYVSTEGVSNTTAGEHPDKQVFNYALSEITSKSKRLTTINSANGSKIVFSYLNSKQDLYGEKELNEITLFNNNSTVDKYRLDYIYQEAPHEEDEYDLSSRDGVPSNGPFFKTDQGFLDLICLILLGQNEPCDPIALKNKYDPIWESEHYSMYLDKIWRVSSSNQILFADFDYYDDYLIPRRFSTQQDQWGYFNNNDRGTLIYKAKWNGQTIVFVNGKPVYEEIPKSPRPYFGWKCISSTGPSYSGAISEPYYEKSLTGAIKSYYNLLGGKYEFYYELNRANETSVDEDDGTIIGGLRLSKSIYYPNSTEADIPIEINYKFLGGSLTTHRVYNYQTFKQLTPPYTFIVHQTSNSAIKYNYTHSGIIGYQQVIEEQKNNGYSIVTFLNPKNKPDVIMPVFKLDGPDFFYEIEVQYPFPPYKNEDYKRGFVSKSEVKDVDDHLITTKTITYSENPEAFTLNQIYGLIPGCLSVRRTAWADDLFWAGRYYYDVGWVGNKNTESTSFDSQDHSTSITSNSENIYQIDTFEDKQIITLSEDKTKDSRDREIINKYYYPLDILDPEEIFTTSAVLEKLKSKRILSYPLKVEKFRDNIKIEGSIHKPIVDEDNDNVLIQTDYELRGESYFPLASYTYKDNFDRIIETKPSNNFTDVYFWGYNDNYIVGQISNSSYAMVCNALISHGYNLDYVNQCTSESELINIFNALRSSLSNSLIISYTYTSAGNLSSETNEKGQTTFYQYDEYNRLSIIRDNDRNIVKKIEYHYKQL